MPDVWLPLRGENDRGMNPKGCFVPGWTTHEYKGVDANYHGDLGLRLDDLIVIDCDGVNERGEKDKSVAVATRNGWVDHIGLPMNHTLLRESKNGFHFFYRRPVAAMGIVTQKLDAIVPHLELLTGMAHQVVWRAPGYETRYDMPMAMFNPGWLPVRTQKSSGPQVEEWDEVPPGMRNNFLTSIGGKLREWGASRAATEEILQAINEEHSCLAKTEVRAIARNVSKYDTGETRPMTCPKCDTTFEVI